MKFVIFDPRPQGADANSQIFETAHGVLGIEVTVPALAARCDLGNLDPQHSEGNVDLAAIEAAMTAQLPGDGATLATVRADLDSIGAMAVLQLRLAGTDLAPASERITLVAESDRFARGGYPGPRPLPTQDNPWPVAQAAAGDLRPLAAIAAAVSDFKSPVEDRVSLLQEWLLTGNEPEQYRQQVEKERSEMITALETGQIKTETLQGGKIAVVVSTHRAATTVGYCLAPVVVALNPAFRFQGGEPHAKFTVCQFAGGFVNLPAALAELQQLEEGWGGSPTIIGSPQGVASTLSAEQVAEVVSRHLL